MAVAESEGPGFVVRLDARPVRTPSKRLLSLPTLALAEQVAGEWAAQGEEVQPATMRLNRLATTAVDLMADRRSGAVEQVADYARTDLLCYRASHPADLVALQARHWEPPLAWLEAAHGITLRRVEGLMPQPQPEAAVRALASLVAGHGDWPLVGLHAVTTATGSLVLGLMVTAGALAADAAADAALVDERYERAQWGDEADAVDREARLLADVAAAGRFLAALTA